MTGDRRSRGRGPILVAAAMAVAALLVGSAGASLRLADRSLERALGGQGGDSWRIVLRQAWNASQQRRYTGEALGVVWEDGVSRVSLSTVLRDRDTLTVSADDRFTMHLGEDGGTMVDHDDGWLAPLPPADPGGAGEVLRAIEEKYDVALVGEDRLLDRAVHRLEMRRRSDGGLRERLWVDDESGLVLRRESFEGDDRRLRMVAFLSLDLRPGRGRTAPRAARGGDGSLERRSHSISVIEEGALSALRRAGWTVPTTLPGGYEPVGVYAVDDSEGQPLQVVYGDGLYTVSLFQQRGQPDWDSLPEGAQRAEDLGWHAYEWPGAVPQRLVWEASGTTFSLVGDAPPQEFVAIAESLPRPAATTLADRLRRGLSRVWQWVSQ